VSKTHEHFIQINILARFHRTWIGQLGHLSSFHKHSLVKVASTDMYQDFSTVVTTVRQLAVSLFSMKSKHHIQLNLHNLPYLPLLAAQSASLNNWSFAELKQQHYTLKKDEHEKNNHNRTPLNQ